MRGLALLLALALPAAAQDAPPGPGGDRAARALAVLEPFDGTRDWTARCAAFVGAVSVLRDTSGAMARIGAGEPGPDAPDPFAWTETDVMREWRSRGMIEGSDLVQLYLDAMGAAGPIEEVPLYRRDKAICLDLIGRASP